jgi:hypothetical protein
MTREKVETRTCTTTPRYVGSTSRIVGAAAIARELCVRPSTVYSWGKRDNSPITIYHSWNGTLWTTQDEIDRCWGRSAVACSPTGEMEREAELAINRALEGNLTNKERS